jgi:hypothetical protein
MQPRVLKLVYRHEWTNPNRNRVKTTAPLPLAFRAGDFDVSFEDGHWVFTPCIEFNSEEFARATLEPLLRDWEIEWDILRRLRFSLKFEDCVLEQPARTESDPIQVACVCELGA